MKKFNDLTTFGKILKEVVTGSAFNVLSFKKALTDGAFLTEDVVYLAYLRGYVWLEACSCAKHFTPEAASLCNSLYEGFGSFWSLCIGGYRDETGKMPPNYFMAYIIDPENTLTYLSVRGLWSSVEEDILSQLPSGSHLRVYCKHFFDTATKNK